ncbi:MAG: hypothetical protein AAF485_25940, partial [Chloroflexota bacterium]
MTDITIHHLLDDATQRLAEAKCDTPQLDAQLLLAHTLGQDRTWLYLNPTASLTPLQLDHFDRLL